MSTIKYIQNKVRKFLNEDYGIDAENFFDSFPESVRQTLFDEYGKFRHRFDWNSKQDEFSDPADFQRWMKVNEKNEFLRELDNIIKMTTQDLMLIKQRRIATNQLKAFEELIIPSLGNGALTPAMSMYEEIVMLSPSLSLKEMEEELRKAKDIIDQDGSIDPLKTTPSELFTGGDINIPGFERFVKENPEYQGVYNDWKKLHDKDFEMNINTELQAYRDTTSEVRVKELRNFLIQFKQRNLN